MAARKDTAFPPYVATGEDRLPDIGAVESDPVPRASSEVRGG